MIPVKIIKDHRRRFSNTVHPSSFDNLDIRHPLEPVNSLEEWCMNNNGSLQNGCAEGDEFSFMNSQPAIINVQVKDDDNKGDEVNELFLYYCIILNIFYF